MSSVWDRAVERRRRRLAVAVKEELRDLNIQLSLLNRRFGGQVELREIDWTCLDLINRHGPLSPSELARWVGVHPATLTGVLGRLQKGGWIVRERDPESSDKRAVTVHAVHERNSMLFEAFAGMGKRMDELCDRYSEAELEVIADFLRRTGTAGFESAEELAE
jgi:DNA-binding MarR family transcriptional regulator